MTWLGFLTPFFVAAGIGATIYCFWTLWVYVKLGAPKTPELKEEENGKE